MKTLYDDVTPLLQMAVREILMYPLAYKREWTVQGFGMMRTYLDPEKTWRLNIYHPVLMVPNVSVVHNHPWDFDSWILGGTLTNIRYGASDEQSTFQHSGTEGEAQYEYARIMTGIQSPVGDAGAGGVMSQGTQWLIPVDVTDYTAGNYYSMHHAEIHETRYTPGCVTLNRRCKIGDGEHATVFWPAGTPWVSAKPRIATQREVMLVTTKGSNAMGQG